MNRRNSLKAIASLLFVGVSSASVLEWFRAGSKIDFNLLAEKKALIAELAETIIPRTSTPGAKDAKVEEYILRMLESCTNEREKHTFLSGLMNLEEYALKNYGSDFLNSSPENKINILKHFEDKSHYNTLIFNKINKKLLGKPFFIKLKELTVQGYCNSELGATKGLAYDYVPSTYQACIRIGHNQRSWATK